MNNIIKRTKISLPNTIPPLLVIMMCFMLLMNTVTLGAPQVTMSNEFYPGDAIDVTFIDINKDANRRTIDVSGEYSIDSRGYVMLPLVGPLKVVGYNRFTLAKKIAEIYKPFFEEPYISIRPLMRVAVMGPFFRPGSYRISPESSLWELIELAGGPRETCDLTSIRVVRGDEVVIEDLLSSFEKGYSLEDIGVQSGDQIVARNKSEFGMRQVFDYLRFGMSLASLYLLILRWESYSK